MNRFSKWLILSILIVMLMTAGMTNAQEAKDPKLEDAPPVNEGLIYNPPDFDPENRTGEYLPTESFETWPPNGWTLDPATETGAWLQDNGTDYGPGTPHTGTSCAFFDDYDYSSGTTGQMITPVMDLSSAADPSLMFWYYDGGGYDGGGSDYVSVQISTDGTTYTGIYTTPLNTTAWELCSVDLAAYVGQANVTIAFVGTSVWGYSNPHIDDVSVGEPPPPAIAVNYNAGDFGLVPTGNTGYLGGFTVTNVGGGTLTIDSITDLSGTEFSTGFAYGDVSLAQGETSETFDFYYSPSNGGVDSVDFVITSTSGTVATIALTGEGLQLPDNMVQIGTEMNTNTHLPIEPWYRYTYSQSIYTQDELDMDNMRIESIWYHYNGYQAFDDELVVYMGHTAKTAFASTSDWIDVGDLQQVFDGTFSVPDTSGWVEIILDTPFYYNNSDNLVIGVDENTEGFHSDSTDFYASTTPINTNMSIVYYSDGTNPNPSSPSNGILYTYRPNTRIQLATYELPSATVVPVAEDFEDSNLLPDGWYGDADGNNTTWAIDCGCDEIDPCDNAAAISGIGTVGHEWLVTPWIVDTGDTPENHGLVLEFSVKVADNTLSDSVEVWMSTTQQGEFVNRSNFEQIWSMCTTEFDNVNLPCEEFEICIPNVDSIHVAFVFEYTQNVTLNGWAVDDITLERDYAPVVSIDQLPDICNPLEMGLLSGQTTDAYPNVEGDPDINIGETYLYYSYISDPLGPIWQQAGLSSSYSIGNGYQINAQIPQPTVRFEGVFPPEGWTMESGTAGYTGETFTRGVIGMPGASHTGDYGVSIFADSFGDPNQIQDQWLISPSLSVNSGDILEFYSENNQGSVNGDHYYIQITTNGGTDWTELLDLSDDFVLADSALAQHLMTDAPYQIDLSTYAGQTVQIAWNAYEIVYSAMGMWYIDDIRILPSGPGSGAVAEYWCEADSVSYFFASADYCGGNIGYSDTLGFAIENPDPTINTVSQLGPDVTWLDNSCPLEAGPGPFLVNMVATDDCGSLDDLDYSSALLHYQVVHFGGAEDAWQSVSMTGTAGDFNGYIPSSADYADLESEFLEYVMGDTFYYYVEIDDMCDLNTGPVLSDTLQFYLRCPDDTDYPGLVVDTFPYEGNFEDCNTNELLDGWHVLDNGVEDSTWCSSCDVVRMSHTEGTQYSDTLLTPEFVHGGENLLLTFWHRATRPATDDIFHIYTYCDWCPETDTLTYIWTANAADYYEECCDNWRKTCICIPAHLCSEGISIGFSVDRGTNNGIENGNTDDNSWEINRVTVETVGIDVATAVEVQQLPNTHDNVGPYQVYADIALPSSCYDIRGSLMYMCCTPDFLPAAFDSMVVVNDSVRVYATIPASPGPPFCEVEYPCDDFPIEYYFDLELFVTTDDTEYQLDGDCNFPFVAPMSDSGGTAAPLTFHVIDNPPEIDFVTTLLPDTTEDQHGNYVVTARVIDDISFEDFDTAYENWTESYTGVANVGIYSGGYYDDNNNSTDSSLEPVSLENTLVFNDVTGTVTSWVTLPQQYLLAQPAANSGPVELTFWQSLRYWPGYHDYHGIWISTGSSDPASGEFVELAELNSTAKMTVARDQKEENERATAWVQETVDLSAYIGQDVYIAFRYDGDFEDEWYIDDIKVSPDPEVIPTIDDESVTLHYYVTDRDGTQGTTTDISMSVPTRDVGYYEAAIPAPASGEFAFGDVVSYWVTAGDLCDYNSDEIPGFNDVANGNVELLISTSEIRTLTIVCFYPEDPVVTITEPVEDMPIYFGPYPVEATIYDPTPLNTGAEVTGATLYFTVYDDDINQGLGNAIYNSSVVMTPNDIYPWPGDDDDWPDVDDPIYYFETEIPELGLYEYGYSVEYYVHLNTNDSPYCDDDIMSDPEDFLIICPTTTPSNLQTVGWQDPTVSDPGEHIPMTSDMVYLDWDLDPIFYHDPVAESWFDVGINATNNMLAVRFDILKASKLTTLSAAIMGESDGLHDASVMLVHDNNGQPSDPDNSANWILEQWLTVAPNPQNVNVNLTNRGTMPWVSVSLMQADGMYPEFDNFSDDEVWPIGEVVWGIFTWEQNQNGQDVARLFVDAKDLGDALYGQYTEDGVVFDIDDSHSFRRQDSNAWYEDEDYNYMMKLDTAPECFSHFDVYRNCTASLTSELLNSNHRPDTEALISDEDLWVYGSGYYDVDGFEYDTFLDCDCGNSIGSDPEDYTYYYYVEAVYEYYDPNDPLYPYYNYEDPDAFNPVVDFVGNRPQIIEEGVIVAPASVDLTLVVGSDYYDTQAILVENSGNDDLWFYDQVVEGNIDEICVTNPDGDEICSGEGGCSSILTENFENGWPTGWAEYHTGIDAVNVNDAAAYSGAQSLQFDDVFDVAQSWVILPQLTGANALNFWQALNYWDIGYHDYHGIWVSTGSSDPADGNFVEVQELNISDGTANRENKEDADRLSEWEQIVVDLSAYTGQSIYIAFVYEGSYEDEWYIDDIDVCGEGGGGGAITTETEPNDDIETANGPMNYDVNVTGSVTGGGVEVPDRYDWFYIDVLTAGNITIDLFFIDNDGDLDLNLYNSEYSIGYSGSVSDNEQINYTVAQTGRYYIRVHGYGNSSVYTNSYTLGVSYGTRTTLALGESSDAIPQEKLAELEANGFFDPINSPSIREISPGGITYYEVDIDLNVDTHTVGSYQSTVYLNTSYGWGVPLVGCDRPDVDVNVDVVVPQPVIPPFVMCDRPCDNYYADDIVIANPSDIHTTDMTYTATLVGAPYYVSLIATDVASADTNSAVSGHVEALQNSDDYGNTALSILYYDQRNISHAYFTPDTFEVQFVYNGDTNDMYSVTVISEIIPYAELWIDDVGVSVSEPDPTLIDSISGVVGCGENDFCFNIWAENCAEVDQIQIELTDLNNMWDGSTIEVTPLIGAQITYQMISDNVLLVELTGTGDDAAELDFNSAIGGQPILQVCGEQEGLSSTYYDVTFDYSYYGGTIVATDNDCGDDGAPIFTHDARFIKEYDVIVSVDSLHVHEHIPTCTECGPDPYENAEEGWWFGSRHNQVDFTIHNNSSATLTHVEFSVSVPGIGDDYIQCYAPALSGVTGVLVDGYGYSEYSNDSQPPVEKQEETTYGSTPVDENLIRQGGDTSDDAFVIDGLPFTDTGTTVGYTGDYGPYTGDGLICGGTGVGASAADVVYMVTLAEATLLNISLCGSSYDTALGILNDMGVPVAGNDDFCEYQSDITCDFPAGTYYIVVDGYGNDAGEYTLTVGEAVQFGHFVFEGSFAPGDHQGSFECDVAWDYPEGSYPGGFTESNNRGSYMMSISSVSVEDSDDFVGCVTTEAKAFQLTDTKGDCNNSINLSSGSDDEVNVTDVVTILNNMVESNVNLDEYVMDFNDDYLVNVSDAYEMILYIVRCYDLPTFDLNTGDHGEIANNCEFAPTAIATSNFDAELQLRVDGDMIYLDIANNVDIAALQIDLNHSDLVLNDAVKSDRLENMTVQSQFAENTGGLVVINLSAEPFAAGSGTILSIPFDTEVDGVISVNNVIALDRSGRQIPVTFDSGDVTVRRLPTEFALNQNYPNPFNPMTTILYQLPKAEHVNLRVYNAAGQLVRTLVNENKDAGFYDIQWDGKNDRNATVSSGVYFYQITAGSFDTTKKMMLLK
ncbi:MAG: hypothetical protein B6244_02995 [Candidatus Cloacimonetes bacterium 4572_55]|nr:MAG: hypothetical protein B6244_02995 [Candidatus Cloacimonetes bacterium 4572_55]